MAAIECPGKSEIVGRRILELHGKMILYVQYRQLYGLIYSQGQVCSSVKEQEPQPSGLKALINLFTLVAM